MLKALHPLAPFPTHTARVQSCACDRRRTCGLASSRSRCPCAHKSTAARFSTARTHTCERMRAHTHARVPARAHARSHACTHAHVCVRALMALSHTRPCCPRSQHEGQLTALCGDAPPPHHRRRRRPPPAATTAPPPGPTTSRQATHGGGSAPNSHPSAHHHRATGGGPSADQP